jgi:hypothetical protein
MHVSQYIFVRACPAQLRWLCNIMCSTHPLCLHTCSCCSCLPGLCGPSCSTRCCWLACITRHLSTAVVGLEQPGLSVPVLGRLGLDDYAVLLIVHEGTESDTQPTPHCVRGSN